MQFENGCLQVDFLDIFTHFNKNKSHTTIDLALFLTLFNEIDKNMKALLEGKEPYK